MTERIAFLVQRWEMPIDDSPGCPTVPERVFLTEIAAKEYCTQQDSTGEGFEFICPCGCGERHWRSWEVEAIIMEDK